MKLSILIILIISLGTIYCRQIEVIELNKENWTLRNKNASIKIENVNIPSGVYSEYSKSIGQSEDYVLHSKNDIHLRWLAYDDWTYSCKFESTDKFSVTFKNLIFHGIDTVSRIYLNGHYLGKTDNMFIRYSFDVREFLIEGDNYLEVKIKSPVKAAKTSSAQTYVPPECPPSRYNGECHMNYIRKMQASFSWDWGLAAPSMGIWKSVTLEFYDSVVIRDVDARVSIMPDGSWKMNTKVYLEGETKNVINGQLIFFAVELTDKPILIDTPIINKVLEFDTRFEKNVQLWWPNGYGPQKLYHLNFTFKSSISGNAGNLSELTVSQKSIRVGFRTIEVIQEKLSDGGLSFYFKVNGHPIFMKGTNYIPSHILPELGHNFERIRHLMDSMQSANMNMMRVWGGGIYESDYFYDLADQYGILVWQDMMFACAMYPVHNAFLKSVKTEIVQNVRHIAHHASIAILAGNNENEAALIQNWYGTASKYNRFAKDYRTLYVDTIDKELRTIFNDSRPDPLTSSPSNGIQTIKENYLSKNPQSTLYGDIHHYDYIKDGWDPEIYPKPRFASEYGFQSLPSLAVWKRVRGEHDKLSDLIDHRQHYPMGNFPILQLVRRHLPLPVPDDNKYWPALVYFSQLSQAMVTKIETEVYRRERNSDAHTMGALYWQLNDVWIAPSWSSIDYYGNYKILHYWAKDFLAPLTIIAHGASDGNINVYVSRDTIDEDDMLLSIKYNVYIWNKLFPRKTKSITIKMKSNTAKLAQRLNISEILTDGFNKKNCFIEFLLEDKNGKIISNTFYFPDKIKNAVGMVDPNLKVEISSQIYQYPICSVSIVITVQAPALFVYVEIDHENITNYKLSSNGYIQLEPIKTLHLEFKNTTYVHITEENIKVMTVNEFMN